MSDTEDKETAPEPQPVRNAASGGVAWLALLVSAVALAAVAYTIYEDWRTQQVLALDSGNIEASLGNLSGRIDAANSAVSATSAQLDTLAQADAGVSSKVDLLQRDIDERLRLLDSLPTRISSTGSRTSGEQGYYRVPERTGCKGNSRISPRAGFAGFQRLMPG